MAGMLPGVEAARRRGFHRSRSNDDGATASRRPSFSLYAINNREVLFGSRSSLERSPSRSEVSDDEILDAAVREAKKRLDQRLNCKSGNKRKVKGKDAIGAAEERVGSVDNLQTDLYKLILKSG